uniref:Ubiquitin-like-conjugating enzyme ATG10 n=1 Tax=Nicotiana sylvestris TaxID=4096 RepID=A0A1U7XL41_NICSY|nr:PREDICTED: ubiquitin-like-conjugating enzyme ATG10 isoform X2 [Nicotiana sylvestris]
MSSDKAIINISTWDGTITSTDFYVAASNFAEQWNNLDLGFPHWSWINCPKGPLFAASKVEGYLSLENMILPGSTEEDRNHCGLAGIEDLSCANEDVYTDTAILHKHCSDCATSIDGEPLAIEDLEKEFPAYTTQELAISKWTFITQEEHPYLNRPWYTLHPCGTGDWMKLLFSNEPSVVSQGGVAVEKYLIPWFSVICPIFGLKIPLKLFVNASNKSENVSYVT